MVTYNTNPGICRCGTGPLPAEPYWHDGEGAAQCRSICLQRLQQVLQCVRYDVDAWVEVPAGDTLHKQVGHFYQAHHHQTACAIPPYITMTQPRTRTSHDLLYLPPQVYLDTYKFSFFPRCVKAWNINPSSIVSSSSVNAFKLSFQRYFTYGEIYMVPPRDFCQRPRLGSTSCVAALGSMSTSYTRTVHNPLFSKGFQIYVFGTLAFTL